MTDSEKIRELEQAGWDVLGEDDDGRPIRAVHVGGPYTAISPDRETTLKGKTISAIYSQAKKKA